MMQSSPAIVSPPCTIPNDSAGLFRKSAAIARFPKAKLPDSVDDFGKACARLIEMTFPGRSQNAICEKAAQALQTSPDTIDRILGKRTKHPDPRIMFLCLAIYQSRTGNAFPIGGGYEIRITQVAQ